MSDERYFSSQSRKINFNQNKLEKSVTTINGNKETFNTDKELASNDKETINIDEETIKDDIQTNVYKINCNEETDTNFDNNNTILQVNVNNNDNDQEKICTTVSQNAPPNEKETSQKITKENKNSSPECKRIYIIGESILKYVQGYEISKSLENCKRYGKSFSCTKIRDMQGYVKPTLRENPDQIIVHVGTNDLEVYNERKKKHATFSFSKVAKKKYSERF